MKRKHLILITAILFFIVGCSPATQRDLPSHQSWLEFSSDKKLGQTFVAKYDGLSEIDIFLQPSNKESYHLELNLKEDPEQETSLATTSILLPEGSETGFYKFSFPEQNQSNRKRYYLELVSENSEIIDVGINGSLDYLDGALYDDGIPVNAQMSFSLVYDPIAKVVGLLKEIIKWCGILIVSGFLFVVPGWGMASWLFKGWDQKTWILKSSVAGGLSLAIYPILILWTNLFGLNLGILYAWIPALIGIGLLVLKFIKNRSYKNIRNKIREIKSTDLLLVGIILLLIFTRFWAIRSLDLPMWGDSFQHSMIVQLFFDHGGLFQSWAPYSNLESFTYHFGFHANSAVFGWINGISASQSILWVGQIINVLAVICLIPLATKIGKSPWCEIIVLLIAGLLLEFPGFYINWGRYTQLTGQAILVVGVYFTLELLENDHLDWKLLGLNWILVAGLVLTHYRIAIFIIFFIVAYMILRLRRNNSMSKLINLVLYSLGSGIIIIPWLVNLTKGRIPLIFQKQMTTLPQNISGIVQLSNQVGNLNQYLPFFVWVLLIVCTGWLIWRRNFYASIIALWWLLIFLFTNSNLIGLPGGRTIGIFTVLIGVYIPSSLMISGALSQLTLNHWLESKSRLIDQSKLLRFISKSFVAIIFLGLSLWGAKVLMNISQPYQFSLATRPDILAAKWIESYLPEDSIFLINSFNAFNNNEAVGSDGGWWLPLLAKRQTSISPLMSSFEQEKNISSISEVELVNAIEEYGLDDPAVLQMLKTRGITHVFIGQRQGRVNSPTALLDPEILNSSPNFKDIYHQDQVWIFEIVRNVNTILDS